MQYAAKEYVAHLAACGASFVDGVGELSGGNGFAERWMWTLKDEHVILNEYESLEDARDQIGTFIEEVYQRKRAHSSIGYLPPAIFEERFSVAEASESVARRPEPSRPEARNRERFPKT